MNRRRIITAPVIEDVHYVGMGSGQAAFGRGVAAVDAETLQKQAYAEGFQAGRVEGLQVGIEQGVQQADETLGHALAALQDATTKLVAARRSLLAELEREGAQLAFDIAHKVTEDDRIVPRVVLDGLVRSALSAAAGSEALRLHLNPIDLEAAGQEQVEPALVTAGCELVSDPATPRGVCTLESNFGRIEVDLHERWETISACLSDEMQA